MYYRALKEDKNNKDEVGYSDAPSAVPASSWDSFVAWTKTPTGIFFLIIASLAMVSMIVFMVWGIPTFTKAQTSSGNRAAPHYSDKYTYY